MLMTILLKPNDRRHHQNSGDPLQLLQYCEQILSKIVEIRIRIDRPKPPKIIDKNEFIAMMADPTPYVKPAELVCFFYKVYFIFLVFKYFLFFPSLVNCE